MIGWILLPDHTNLVSTIGTRRSFRGRQYARAMGRNIESRVRVDKG